MSNAKWDELIEFYNLFPFHKHPLWVRVKEGSLSLSQVLNAEKQHYLRTKAGQDLRWKSATSPEGAPSKIAEAAMQTYLEEVSPHEPKKSHLNLIKNLLNQGGISDEELDRTWPTPANSAAIALYSQIGAKGSMFHLIGAGVVEYFYAELSPHIFEAYTEKYGMSEQQAFTYKLHGPMDKDHAQRAKDSLSEPLVLANWDKIKLAVRDAFVATSLHYDGMLQGALETQGYWEGK